MTAPTDPAGTAPAVAGAPPPAAPKPPDHNRTGVDFRRPMPRPKASGIVIDFHCHLLAARHAPAWFEAAAHYGIDSFLTMTPLEEVVKLQREYPGRLQFIVVPKWQNIAAAELSQWLDDWRRRLDMFCNLGSRMVKFHMAPQTIQRLGLKLDAPELAPFFDAIVQRRMGVMTHVGDPETWYCSKYADCGKFGARDEHYAMWERVMQRHPHLPWVGAHLGGNPENLDRLQRLLDMYPALSLDCSATRWMAREISARRDEAREFFVRNAGRIMWGSDQVSGDDRGFDFLASRWWVQRKLMETACIGPSPIYDPDVPEDQQPQLRGLALPDDVLQKIYHDNAIRFLARLGVSFEGWG
ncbi:MAG TPA: amidohydrolase family protein [Tepidisphaeraceae bacterium]|nr:amidohydrolase family protein [Tepidisphaeraceae bacterium]